MLFAITINKIFNKSIFLLFLLFAVLTSITSIVSKVLFMPYPTLSFKDFFNPIIIYTPLFCLLAFFEKISFVSFILLLLITSIVICLSYFTYKYIKYKKNKYLILYIIFMAIFDLIGLGFYAVFETMASI